MKPLTRLRRATARRSHVEDEWRKAIREARESGATFRAIADVAGVSHVRVQQILREA